MVLPALEKMRKQARTPVINMIILNIYEKIATSLGSQIIAIKILPQLIPLLGDDSLSKGEHLAYRNTIQSLVKRLVNEADKRYVDSNDIAYSPEKLM